ncbi:hypothetical protein KTR66_14490 [Roseococcus sp. SDR]|uniref:hypothetical protein n=1 Tax=Roseococcus sp. SDR TaxID=2835532 RepID=UPI001BCDDBD1|nr:hypothetical protein [Roseococcus sp. SDR]MBS7791209.1 hypothetical protein [Roseococcus sp. SDR]MBV1846523.1 hypothetical protein [Roseococcus sp. SDR]
MKPLIPLLLLALAGCVTTSGSTADDRRWITQCVRDNADEGASRRVVTAYCTCMVNRMSNNETRSVTQWERANPRARRECSREAGWT